MENDDFVEMTAEAYKMLHLAMFEADYEISDELLNHYFNFLFN